MRSIQFFEQYEWDDARRAMKFWAKADHETLTCWIHESALQPDEGEGSGESESRQEYFMDHMERIHTLAHQLIVNGELDENNEVFIDAEVVRRLGA